LARRFKVWFSFQVSFWPSGDSLYEGGILSRHTEACCGGRNVGGRVLCPTELEVKAELSPLPRGKSVFCFLFLFFGRTGGLNSASHLLGRYYTTWAILPAPESLKRHE
jgi:hypothetical protein